MNSRSSSISDLSLKDSVQLAMETTGRTASIAVLLGGNVLRQSNLDTSKRTAASMTPEMDQTLRWCENNRHKPDFIAVADGPGSFTGLRIGVTTAKTLCYALGLPLVSVDSLAAIAATVLHDHGEVETVLVATNAYRGQVFCGSFTRGQLLGNAERLEDDSAPVEMIANSPEVGVYEDEHWRQILDARERDVALAGDPQLFGDLAGELLPRSCDAVGVGLLGLRRASCDGWVDPFQLVPRYLKPSAAEEKAASNRS